MNLLKKIYDKVSFRLLMIWWKAENHPRSFLNRILYVPVRYLQGARRIKIGGYSACQGWYTENGADILFGGACPVQGEGSYRGHSVYYRSRGDRWSLDVYDNNDKEVWFYMEKPYFWPEAGWAPAEETKKNIAKALKLFDEHQLH